MLIKSKKTGIVYENICLDKNEIVEDTENMTDVDFSQYEFGYTRLCSDCAQIAGKEIGIEGTHCFNHNCKNNGSSYIGEVIFTKEEIMNDLVIYRK